MDVDNLDLSVILQMLTQLSDVNIHRAGIEVVIIDPDSLQGEIALQNLVRMAAEQGQQFVLLGGKLGLLIANHEQLLLGIEGETTDTINGALLVLLASYTTEDGLNTE